MELTQMLKSGVISDKKTIDIITNIEKCLLFAIQSNLKPDWFLLNHSQEKAISEILEDKSSIHYGGVTIHGVKLRTKHSIGLSKNGKKV